MTYVDLRPDNTRPVQVLVDGSWHPGELLAYRQGAADLWIGYVRWSDTPGQNRLGWFSQEVIRT